MSATWTSKPKDKSLKDFFAEELPRIEILALAVVNVNTAYAAVRNRRQPDEGIYALIIKLMYDPSSRINFGYRLTDETMGPYEIECPQQILDQLIDPPKNEAAQRWREQCRTLLLRKAELPILVEGIRIKPGQPLTVRGYPIDFITITHTDKHRIKGYIHFIDDCQDFVHGSISKTKLGLYTLYDPTAS